MIQQLQKELVEANLGTVLINEPMKKHTTMKIGGPADVLYIPDSIESLQKAVAIITAYNTPITVIGRGSNLLVKDGGIEGVVIKLDKGLDYLKQNGTLLTVGAGYPLVKLATQMARLGLTGLEFAGGIPGSVGGAVFMNAGAHKADIAAILVSAKILLKNGEIKTFSNEEMKYSYRTSVLQSEVPGICIEATFQLREGNKEEIAELNKKNKDYRKDTQPWSSPCAGSIFRNPLPNFAGKLVQEAGLKGYQIGGAQISPMHGNFIVNADHANATDVLQLIQHIKEVVWDKYQVKMETEVEIIGRD